MFMLVWAVLGRPRSRGRNITQNEDPASDPRVRPRRKSPASLCTRGHCGYDTHSSPFRINGNIASTGFQLVSPPWVPLHIVVWHRLTTRQSQCENFGITQRHVRGSRSAGVLIRRQVCLRFRKVHWRCLVSPSCPDRRVDVRPA